MKATRRGILGMFGGALAVGPKAAQQGVVSAFGNAAKMGLPDRLAYGPEPVPMPDTQPPNPFRDAAFRAYRAAQEDRDRRQLYRVNGLDPDLHSLRLPLATKARMQRARDDASLSLVEMLREKWKTFR